MGRREGCAGEEVQLRERQTKACRVNKVINKRPSSAGSSRLQVSSRTSHSVPPARSVFPLFTACTPGVTRIDNWRGRSLSDSQISF